MSGEAKTMSADAGGSESGRWRRDSELPFQKLDEETIVLDPRRREVHLLNESAARLWELLALPQSVDELAATLADEYEANETELRAAVAECVDGLAGKGLLIAVEAR